MQKFLKIRGAKEHNLQNIDFKNFFKFILYFLFLHNSTKTYNPNKFTIFSF